MKYQGKNELLKHMESHWISILINLVIIFICCRTWIAHVLHANENRGIQSSEGEEGRRERWGELTCGGCCGGSRWCSLVAVMLAAKSWWLQVAFLLSSLLCFPSLLDFFFTAFFPFLPFFWSSALFFFFISRASLVPLLCLCIYRQRRAVKMPCLYPVRGQGRVDGHQLWLVPSVFSSMVGHRSIFRQVGYLGRRLFEF